jgi:hypothetical protein
MWVAAILLLPSCNMHLPPDYFSEPHFHLYVYGEKVRFGLGGDAHRFKMHGWSHVEQDFTWTEGIGSTLIFFAPRTAREVTLAMHLTPFVHAPELTSQPVYVTLNGRRIAKWDVNEDKVYTAEIPHHLVEARENAVPNRPNLRDSVVLVFDFLIPKAQFPALVDAGPDWRRLGVACSELVMRKGQKHETGVAPTGATDEDAATYKLGTVVLFGADQNGERYKQSGWTNAERGFTWTGANRAAMQFKITPPPDHPLMLSLRANGNILPPRLLAQPTDVYANGELVAQWEIAEVGEFIAEIPARVLRPDGLLTIEFESRNAVSPRDLGTNAGDNRELGISCQEMVISDADD